MIDLAFHISLHTFLQDNIAGINFNSNYIDLPFTSENKTWLEDHAFQYEEIPASGKIRWLINLLPVKIFSTLKYFRKIKSIKTDSNLMVLDKDNVYSYINEVTYLNFEIASDFYLFSNIRSYISFLYLLKEKENATDGTFQFVDSFNRDQRRIVFINNEKGRISINYLSESPEFDNLHDYSIGFTKFKASLNEDNRVFVKFLKSATINEISKYEAGLRIKKFFENLENIIEKANINFEIFLNDLSVEQLKKDYDDVKTKYLASLGDILSKLSQNILALPIAASALLFSIDKLRGNNSSLVLLPILILTATYFSLLLRLYFNDIIYIQNVIRLDYETLIQNNFFFNHPNEKRFFDDIKDKVTNQISSLKFIIKSYFWMVNLSSLCFIGMILLYLQIPLETVILISIILLFPISFLYNFSVVQEEQSLK